MTPSDSPGPKIGGTCKQRAINFYGGRVIANFVPKKSLPWQRGLAGEKFK